MNLINITFIRRNHEVKLYLRQKRAEVKIKGRLYSTNSPEAYYTRRLFMLMENVFIYEGIYEPLKVSETALERNTDTTTAINARAFALADLMTHRRERGETWTLRGLIIALILETILLFVLEA